MKRLGFNQIAAIAATLEELTEHPHHPIHIEGDVLIESENGLQIHDMDQGEAARVVVESVLQHPYFQAFIDEQERMWEALKWLMLTADSIPTPPPEHEATINSAIDASGWNGSTTF